MELSQPGALALFAEESRRAVDASFHDHVGGGSHTAVTSWCSMCSVLGIPALRPIDPLRSSLSERLSEVDLVKFWAWWRVRQCGTGAGSVRQYLSILQNWHHRRTGVFLAGGMPMIAVCKMLEGFQILTGVPPPRKVRFGCRPADLRTGIDAVLSPSDPLHVNYAASFETGHSGLLRGAELYRTRSRPFIPVSSTTRADVVFGFSPLGELISCTVWAVNSKARGAERFRKLPHYLPIDGDFLSPGRMLYYLCEHADRVPLDLRSSTPLFRDPATGEQLHIDSARLSLRGVMAAAGRVPGFYGVHSLRIGGATARKFVGGSEADIKDAGKWSSDAYMLYVRQRRAEALQIARAACSARVDDFENDMIAIDQDPVSLRYDGSDDETAAAP